MICVESSTAGQADTAIARPAAGSGLSLCHVLDHGLKNHIVSDAEKSLLNALAKSKHMLYEELSLPKIGHFRN
jgi:hypothetical protein